MSPATSMAPALAGPRRAAILLIALGEQASAEMVKNLNEDEVHLVSREIARLDAVSAEQAEVVLEEFHQLLMAVSSR